MLSLLATAIAGAVNVTFPARSETRGAGAIVTLGFVFAIIIAAAGAGIIAIRALGPVGLFSAPAVVLTATGIAGWLVARQTTM